MAGRREERSLPQYELGGSVAIVTGGGRGIGEAVCRRLAREGAAVAVFDIDSAVGESTAAEIVASGGRAIAERVDVTKRADVEEASARVVQEFGSIDVLVNNAGVLRVTPALEIDDAEFELHLAVNAKAVLIGSQIAARQMIKQGRGGRIITIVSTAGRLPSKAPIASYVASKHAAMGLVQQLGLELAPHGILMNAVFPGIVATEMLEDVYSGVAEQTGRTIDEIRQADVDSIPLGRLQTPEDVANIVAFLASADANSSVGQAFDVNGGAFFW
jgi:NAD(P)-dependent dehydrogenase (short-subunit alcohol dehydrogenase family)